MRATHKDAEDRYSIIRQSVIDELNRSFLTGSQNHPLTAKLIDQDALLESKLWSNSKNRLVDWEWQDGYSSFRFRYPKRFEMALWNKSRLVSLSLGRPTYQGTKLRLDFIEANPDKPKELKVFEPTFLAMVGYAEALGARELRIMNPINEEVRAYYERFGFDYVRSGHYLQIKL